MVSNPQREAETPTMSARDVVSARTQTPRFHALDGLRGIAALLVVLVHVEWPNHITNLLFVRNGYLAVDLFFILSGLVIAANYSTRIVDVRTSMHFIALRFFRVYPLHFAMLIAFVGLECLKVSAKYTLGITPEHQPFTGGQSPLSLVSHVFLGQGLGLLPTPGWNGPSWSISCEFVAYVFFAIITLLGLTRRRACLIAGAIATATAYGFLALTRGTLNIVYDLAPLRCIAGFFWGVLIYRWSTTASSRSLKHLQGFELGVAAAVIVTMATVSGAISLVVIPLFVLLVALLLRDRGAIARLLMTKPIQYLGEISYSVYMVHAFIIVCLIMILKRMVPVAYSATMQRDLVTINPWIGDALVFAVVVSVVLLASRTYVLIEQPGRLFGRKALQYDGAIPESGRPSIRVGVAAPSLESIGMRQQ